ncbi:hypothetical protein EK21DRAFT_63155 [Setomelanomma holmii]|uniref:ATPase synthesis protein 25 n=1 Tax=Setomelanomma holmii TaxID=210430 RepID=A0A9P4HEC6_9PLEO|nr:hypothetical protein EK21DRAFT_63155 [Setomelanomma holmii]
MSLLRTTSSSFICRACQRATVRPPPVPRNDPASRASSSVTAVTRAPSRCAFSTSALRVKDRNNLSAEDPEFDFLNDGAKSPTSAIDIVETTATKPIETPGNPTPAAEIAPTTHDSSVPWYLRQHSSVRDQGQQAIEVPELPPNPPPLLKTILEYISITAGLDDLQLLDLRHLDPPPALGPKLIMIIATARSEKHLHVAADRFARYLRREHDLKANAAGLLGRNELKIKLRRKAKRMRMLANVGGAVPEGNIDDGIRTGWICCTLSKIEAHPDDMHMPGDNVQEFVGFRDVKPGVNVVVQMFTEEKRAETDLETLWGGVLRSHQRQDEAVDEKLKELLDGLDGEEDLDVLREEHASTPSVSSTRADGSAGPGKSPNSVPSFKRSTQTEGDLFPPFPDLNNLQQPRRLHTVGSAMSEVGLRMAHRS